MAGSLNHIVDDETGKFQMSTIDNLGDAHEALDECFKVILKLTGGDRDKVNEALKGIGPKIDCDMKPGGEDAL